MQLNKLLNELSILEKSFDYDDDFEINKLEYDSRKIGPNDLFFAIKGFVTDGHRYISEAKKNGAIVCIVEDFVDVDILQIRVKDTRFAMSAMAAAYYGHPSKYMDVIGITATLGKTSSCFMLKEIYERAGYEIGVIGTVYVKAKDFVVPPYLTTPESLDLQRYLAKFRELGVQKVLMEVSSSALELHRSAHVKYKIVSFNNLFEEHIANHGSFEAYKKYKSRLITWASPDTIAVLNMGDEFVASLLPKTKAKVFQIHMADKSKDAFVSDIDLSTGFGRYKYHLNEQAKILLGPDLPKSFEIELGNAGYSSLLNSFMVASIALADKIEVQKIKEGLRNFRGVMRRFEIIYQREFTIIDDYSHNEANVHATMEAISKMPYERLIVLWGIRGKRGAEVNAGVARAFSYWLKKLGIEEIKLCLSKDKVGFNDEVTAEELEAVLSTFEASGIKTKLFDNLSTAIDRVFENAAANDLYLIGGGHAMDKGAELVLNKLAHGLVEEERKKILSVLDKRK